MVNKNCVLLLIASVIAVPTIAYSQPPGPPGPCPDVAGAKAILVGMMAEAGSQKNDAEATGIDAGDKKTNVEIYFNTLPVVPTAQMASYNAGVSLIGQAESKMTEGQSHYNAAITKFATAQGLESSDCQAAYYKYQEGWTDAYNADVAFSSANQIYQEAMDKFDEAGQE